jgi:hypothetical protein
MPQTTVRRTVPIAGCSISLQDITKLFRTLTARVKEAADIEVDGYQKPLGISDEEFERLRAYVRNECYAIWVTVHGQRGEELSGSDETVFSSPALPDTIAGIFMSSRVAYQVRRQNLNPRNYLELTLDFTKPPLLDWRNPVSSPTLNVSILNVSGDKESWVAAVSSAVRDWVETRKNRRAFIHKPFVYDFGLWLFGAPAGLLVCSVLSPLFEQATPVVKIGAYMYAFFMTLFVYRLLFGYTRWAFPTVEILGSRDTARMHRRFWYAVMVSIVGGAIWQLFG